MRPRRFLAAATASIAPMIPAGCTIPGSDASRKAGSVASSPDPRQGVDQPQVPAIPQDQLKATATPAPTCTVPGAAPIKVPAKTPAVGPTAAESDWGIPPGRLLFTLDDSGDDQNINALLDYAAKRNVQIAFFLTANWARKGSKNPCAPLRQVVQRMYREGFYVGNHSWSHPSKLMSRSDAMIRGQIARGVASNCFRPPEGSINRTVRRLAASQGYRLCHWTYDTSDYLGLSADRLVDDVRATLADPGRRYQLDGGIFLGHVLEGSNIFDVKAAGSPDQTAFGQIITLLEEAGIQPCHRTGKPVGQAIPFPVPCA